MPDSTLRSPSKDACELVLRTIGALDRTPPDWRPQAAAGSRLAPAADARKVWTALDGWAKLTVPSEYEDIEGDGYYTTLLTGWKRRPLPSGPGEIEIQRKLSLPDQWPQDRHYHHAWYALGMELSPREGEAFWLRFDAVAHSCIVFVNGREAGRHLGGYTPFEMDVTSLVCSGGNTIAIWTQDDTAVRDIKRRAAVAMLDCGKGVIHDNFAGIRGGIYLERRVAAHVARVRIRPSTRKRELRVETWVHGLTSAAAGDRGLTSAATESGSVTVRHVIYEWPEGRVPVFELPVCKAAGVAARGDTRVEVSASWPDPKPWSPAHPNLYVLRTTVTAEGRSESIDTRFGFREFWIDGKRFMLNGKPIRLFGDGGHTRELRSIVPEAAREYDRRVFEFLKREFNYMASRLHKLVFPVWAIQAADEAGVLVIHQSGMHSPHRDWYQRGGEELMRNLEVEFGEWYWRDANSPSVVIWDVENELIRGKRGPELTSWVLRLDSFIKKHDPDAITEHSGAGWYDPAQQIIHVHMHEQYSRIMRDWGVVGKVPLNLGEFWIGGNGETRLPNSLEYHTREDWHREEARLYRERMLEMRYHGVWGIMPHRLTHWPLAKAGPILSQEDVKKLDRPIYEWSFPSLRAFGARGMAPVVGFVWPRAATVVEGEPFTREIVVCNDREEEGTFKVSCAYGVQRQEWEVTLGPAAQRRFTVSLMPERGVSELVVEVQDLGGGFIEGDRVRIHTLPKACLGLEAMAEHARKEDGSPDPSQSARESRPTEFRRRIVVVPCVDAVTADALDELGVVYEVSAELPARAGDTIVLVPPGAADDALGSSAGAVRRYLVTGGRLLALAQDKPPRWMPLGLPFWLSERTSVPAYTGAGWAPTNRDQNYTREAPVYADAHPALAHLTAADIKDWHPADGRVSDDAFIRPNAMNMRAGGAYRVLIGATRRENASLLEVMSGEGTAVFCQAHVLRARAHPAARAVFFNLLRYLDGPGWSADIERVGLLGRLSPDRLAGLTGMARDQFVPVADAASAPRLTIAGDGADTGVIRTLAETGRRVLVLSAETCARMPGFNVEQEADCFYSGTRAGAEDHPVFWGVAGSSFLPLEHTPARGALAVIPADARVLLGGQCRGHSPFKNDWTLDIGFYGLETREPAPPLAALQRAGAGEIIATTIEPWDQRAETHRQLLVALLANAGVRVPLANDQANTIEVKHTVPLCFDGQLDDWTNDTDDVNISVHSHAQPITMTGKDCVAGHMEGDMDLSGIVYLLHDERHLYVGGIVFAAGRSAVLNIDLREGGGQTVSAGSRVRMGRRLSDPRGMAIEVVTAACTVKIDGQVVKPASMAVGRQGACDVIDTRLLNLTTFNRQIQKAEACPDVPGDTFEVALPWSLLGFDKTPDRMQARIRLTREDGIVLQRPMPGDDGAEFLALLPRDAVLPEGATGDGHGN